MCATAALASLFSQTLSGCRRAASNARGPIELWIGGDVHLGEDPGPKLASLKSALAGAVGIVNLEGPVGDAPPPPDEGVRLSNAARTLASLHEAGVRVAGIANNHAGDRGPSGPEETVRALSAANLLVAGGPAGAAVLSVAGQRAVVTAHDLAATSPIELEVELEEARKKGDVLVATFHVTGPPSYLPRPELRVAADIAVQAGARVIAAHGTHALGPVERRGEIVIAWGLGNLLFACDCTNEIDGAILRVKIEGDQVHARVVPIDAGLRGGEARPSHDPKLIVDLLDALGSSPLTRDGESASF